MKEAVIAQVAITALSLTGLTYRTSNWQSLTEPEYRQRIKALLAQVKEPLTPADSPGQHKLKVASAHSAIMLVAPMYLLNASLSLFLVGLGIYLGRVFTMKSIPSYGSSSLNMLIIYIVTTIAGLSPNYVARSLKYLENLSRKRYHNPGDSLGL